MLTAHFVLGLYKAVTADLLTKKCHTVSVGVRVGTFNCTFILGDLIGYVAPKGGIYSAFATSVC